MDGSPDFPNAQQGRSRAMVRLNPKAERDYRVKLAKMYLSEAEQAYEGVNYRGTVESSQLAAENAAKAIVAVYRVPSWSHDPSQELLEVSNSFPPNLKESASTLATLAHDLAPEHGRVT